MNSRFDTRIAALEKSMKSTEEIYFVFVNPPAGAIIDNRTVFSRVEDVPEHYFKEPYPVKVYIGIDPGRI